MDSIKKNRMRLIPGVGTYWGDIAGNISEQTDLVDYISTHGGGGSSAVWGSITGNLSEQLDLMEKFSSYALLSDIPSLDGYATESWVSGQGYLSSVPSEYATKSWVSDQGYLTSSALSGYATESWVVESLSSYALLSDIPSLDGYATESWVSGQGYLTSSALSGYATESWVSGQGYLTSSALSGYTTDDDFKTINGESIVGEGDIEILTPEQEDAVDVIVNAGDGYLKHTPAITYVEGMSNVDIDYTQINSGYVKNLVNTIGDKVYAYNPDENTFFRFNQGSFSFDQYELFSDGATPQQIYPMWSDSQGRVYYGNSYVFNIDDDNKTVELLYQELGGAFQEHTGTIKSNIIKKDGVVYMISMTNACAYIFNESTQYFDSSIPVQGTFPSSTFYRYLSEFEGHWIYDGGSTQTELVFHLNEAEPYVEWVTLENRLFPGAWTYEYEGQTINETTRGVFVHPVVKNGVTDWYTIGYARQVMYKLVNGAWSIVDYNQTVSGMTTNAGGCACGTLWFGFAYRTSAPKYLIIWNMDESAVEKPDSYTWEQIDLSGYATEDWVSGQGYAYSYQLNSYAYDPYHHLDLTGMKPLVDGKVIANTDMCILNRSYIYPGPSFEGVAGFNYMSDSNQYYFVTPSGRLIYTDSSNMLAYEFNGTQWVQLQSVTNFVSGFWRVELNDGLYVVNDEDIGLYRWDDTNSDWEYIIQVPDVNIWAADANTLRCSYNQKLVNNGGTYQWEEDEVSNYPGALVCAKLGQNYYYMTYELVLTYDESQKAFTQIGVTVYYAEGMNWFTYDGCLYYFTETGIRKVDPSQVSTDQWDTITDIYYSYHTSVYVDYDNKIWTAEWNDSLGYTWLGYTYDVAESSPAVPAQNGTYVLKAVRTNAGVTYSWVEDVDAQAIQITNQILG